MTRSSAGYRDGMTADERDRETERPPGATNAAESATPESRERAAAAAGAGHGAEDDRQIDGGADAGPGEDPEGATPDVDARPGDPLAAAHDEQPLPPDSRH
jgi:hypothetical protein